MKFVINALMTVLFAFCLSLSCFAVESHFELSAGIKSGGDQSKVISAVYPSSEISGLWGALSLEFGYVFYLSDKMSIYPSFEYAITNFKTETMLEGYYNDQYNTYSLTGLSFQYDLNEGADSSYIGFKVARSRISFDEYLNRIDRVESDGLATGIFIGISDDVRKFEFGFQKIPATVHVVGASSLEADFGGAYFMFRSSF